MDDELLEKMGALYVFGGDPGAGGNSDGDKEEDATLEGPSSYISTREKKIQPSRQTRCEACREEKLFFDVARAPCGHEYCRECLQQLFESSMTDNSLFPPRCCRSAFVLAAVRPFLTSALAKEFQQKELELSTPNRTYCCAPACSAFIPPRDIASDSASCKNCGMITCAICKNAAHDGDCPEDADLQKVLGIANDNGWQRCYSCRRIVELDHGCNHIT
jgi:hypothetical protein